MKTFVKLLCGLILFSAVVVGQADKQVILAGKLFDPVSGTVKSNVLIVVEKGVIKNVLPSSARSDNPITIDLSGSTVLPGLIDTHTHVAYNSYDRSVSLIELGIAAYGIIGAKNAEKTLLAGFTTVRDVGTDFYADVAIRNAINRGWIPGPRMYVSASALTITGGHGSWENSLAPHLELKVKPTAVVDGADEVRKQVRLHIKNGVDVIKINATGGFGTSGTVPGAASFSIAEMKAAVEEARKAGKKVAAHAHGAEGIKNAILAGVDSIEHGTFLDDESVALMKEHKVFLVMDVLAAYVDLIEADKDYMDKQLGMTNKELYEKFEANFMKAYTAGVRMAFGTDSSVFPHGQNGRQFLLMQKAGMKPIDAIRSATINAAQLIGIEKDAGTIEVGKWADIIAVKGDPLSDLSLLERVEFVMKAGTIYKQ
ncbi:MAG TPA: amidohydrolase family protein [Pyrinomonadaceae bacterium]